ncbi:unnamed protein product [Caenorhabditis brenneri]
MASSIPLHRLPLNAIKVVFGQLFKCDVESIICLSTCSTKTKCLVKSMKLKKHSINVHVKNTLSISFSILNQPKYSVWNPTGITDLKTLTPCRLFIPGISTLLSKPSVRDWVDHFLYIFNQESIDLQFTDFLMWTDRLESIYESLKGLSIDTLNISEVDEEELNFEILRLFRLMTNLYMGEFDGREEPDVSEASFNQLRGIITGNMERISLRQRIPLDLDTLLIMNGIEIHLSSPRLSDQDFNMFLKLWVQGSNPRLEMLECFYPEDGNKQFSKSVILRGIQYKKHSRNLKREFKSDRWKNSTFLLSGGYDIWRKDGTIATFWFKRNSFDMFVWSSTDAANNFLSEF